MVKRLSRGWTALIATAVIAACSPAATATEFPPEVQTAAARTIEASLSTEPERTPLPTPTEGEATPSLGITPSPGRTASPSPTITPTYSTPVLRITENTNCRTGPGTQYDILFTFLPGAAAEITAYYPESNYWVVKLPDSKSTCWIWGQYATPVGSYWTVPSTTPPATATSAPPEAPTGLRYTYSCTFNGVDTDIAVNLEWTDRSDNEQGFRVLRNDKPVADLPADTTKYSETFSGSPTDKLTYSVQVFASTGTAQSEMISFSCQ